MLNITVKLLGLLKGTILGHNLIILGLVNKHLYNKAHELAIVLT